MARILAIDYGKKRTGIAVTDELQLIASGLCTIETKELFKFLTNYLATEKVSLILVGQPKKLNNTFSAIETEIAVFVKKLQQIFVNIEIKRIDERFTSKMAFRTLIDSGLKQKKRRNKALLDEISATIILQSYLYHK